MNHRELSRFVEGSKVPLPKPSPKTVPNMYWCGNGDLVLSTTRRCYIP